MNPVLSFSVLYAGVLLVMTGLAAFGLSALSPYIQPVLIVLAAWASGATRVSQVLTMLLTLALMNFVVMLGLAGPVVLPALWSEYRAAPVLLTLWMLSTLIVPGLLIAGGVWLRHIAGRIRRQRR